VARASGSSSPQEDGTSSKIVIKIGGSFLTRKDLSDIFPTTLEHIRSQRDRFLRLGPLESVIDEIIRASVQHRFLVVHGAGPFGHALVQRFRSGTEMDPRDIHKSMVILNSALLSAFSRRGFPAQTVSPFDTAKFDGEFHTEKLTSSMLGCARKGILPISHGDIVPAPGRLGSVNGYEVISGDLIARDLALAWPADRIVMVTDLDGILDRDPKLGEGGRIPTIGLDECLRLLRGRSGPSADVTGGIGGKILACRDAISAGIPLQIVSGLVGGNLTAACDGKDAGTVVHGR